MTFFITPTLIVEDLSQVATDLLKAELSQSEELWDRAGNPQLDTGYINIPEGTDQHGVSVKNLVAQITSRIEYDNVRYVGNGHFMINLSANIQLIQEELQRRSIS